MRSRWMVILATAALVLTGCGNSTQTKGHTSVADRPASSPAAPTTSTAARASTTSVAAAPLPLTTIKFEVRTPGAQPVQASFALTRLLPLSDARLTSTFAKLGYSDVDSPLGCNISNPARDLAAVGTFTATAAVPKQLADLNFGMFVNNPDSDPVALFFGPNCGNVGRDGYWIQTTNQGETEGPDPVEIVVHDAQANPGLARQVVIGFGAGATSTRSVATLTTTSPYAQIVSSKLARLLIAQLP